MIYWVQPVGLFVSNYTFNIKIFVCEIRANFGKIDILSMTA